MRNLIAVFCALILAGCTAPGNDEVFDDVRTLAGTQGEDLVWRRSAGADYEAEVRVRALLAEPLTMASVAEVALANSPDLQDRFEEVGIARAAVVAAGRPRNPVLAAATRFPQGGGPLEIDLGLTTSLFDIFLIPARTRVANATLEARTYQVADTVRALAHEARQTAVRYGTARSLRDVAREQRAVADAALAYARSLHEAGNLSDLPLTDYEAADAEAVLAEDAAALELELAAAALSRVMGLSAENSPGWQWAEGQVEEPLLPVRVEDATLARLVALAGEHRLDLAGARHRIEAVAEERGIAVSWRGIDEIEGGVEAERSGDGWAIGPALALSLPIFHQGQVEVSRLDAELRQARRAYEALGLAIGEEVQGALERLRRAATRVRHYRARLLPLYERAVGLAQRNYNFMIEGAFVLLERKGREVEARRGYLEARRDYRLALADLERALGGPPPDDLFGAVAGPEEPGPMPAPAHHHQSSHGE